MKKEIEARLDEQASLVFEFDKGKVLAVYIQSIEFDNKIYIDIKNIESEFLTDILQIYNDSTKKYN